MVFGVLTFIGAAMLLLALLYRPFSKVPPFVGFLVSAYLFYVFRWVNAGFLQLIPGKSIAFPQSLYHGLPATFLGFMDGTFYSTDYFSFLPWIFLYLTGFFLYGLIRGDKKTAGGIWSRNIPPLSFLGRHSLLVYLLHQPVIYMCCVLYMNYIR